jgi:hypothetical protein
MVKKSVTLNPNTITTVIGNTDAIFPSKVKINVGSNLLGISKGFTKLKDRLLVL